MAHDTVAYPSQLHIEEIISKRSFELFIERIDATCTIIAHIEHYHTHPSLFSLITAKIGLHLSTRKFLIHTNSLLKSILMVLQARHTWNLWNSIISIRNQTHEINVEINVNILNQTSCKSERTIISPPLKLSSYWELRWIRT